jgi:hypothetical protein
VEFLVCGDKAIGAAAKTKAAIAIEMRTLMDD